MNTMALRSLSKINSNALQNSRRLFSYKFEMTPRVAQESTSSNVEEIPITTTTEDHHPGASADTATTGNFRYNLSQQRSNSSERPSNVNSIVNARKHLVQSAIEQQHLQPATMPEYYQRKMERSAFVNTDPEPSESDNALSQRRFQVSKTHANATFPLKSVKLASPFPEPVKIMMSRTVSDEEKAEQMLAEARSQRSFSDWGKQQMATSGGQRNLSSGIRRWYSSSKQVGADPDKCKKMKKVEKKGCPKMFLPGCPPKARHKCVQEAKIIHCKKQESPYPAYSEFCHEDLDEKPSECKLCPWSPEDHPTFKAPKKHYHTSAPLAFRKTGLEVDEQFVVDKTETEDQVVSSNTPASPQETGDHSQENVEEEKGMLCDLRKPDCDRPANRRCPPGSTKENKKEKGASKGKKKAPKKKADATATTSSSPDIEAILGNADNRPRSILSLKDSGGHKKGGCKIRKFKFPECGKVPERQKVTTDERCPKKQKKRKMIDCPPDDSNEKCAREVVEEYSMAKGKGIKKDETRCPKIDMTIEKKEEEDDDPCKLKKKGGTKICPGDLLQRGRRKPKKKSSEIVTPPFNEAPKKEQPQPQLTVNKPPI